MSSREDFVERGAVSLELPSGFAARKRFPLEKENRSRRIWTFFPSGTEKPSLEAGGYRRRRGRYTLYRAVPPITSSDKGCKELNQVLLAGTPALVQRPVTSHGSLSQALKLGRCWGPRITALRV